MTAIKKQYIEIAEILEANSNKKVSTILPQLLELMTKANTSGNNGSTVLRGEEGEVIAIYCYYHKAWERVSHAEYGLKANTASGYNTMCKQGLSAWSKQQRAKKAAESQLLADLTSRLITTEQLPQAQLEILEATKAIVPRDDNEAFATAEEVLQA